LVDRLQRSAFRLTQQASSGLKVHNYRNTALDAGRRAHAARWPTLREELGGDVSETALSRLIEATSRRAFEGVRTTLASPVS